MIVSKIESVTSEGNGRVDLGSVRLDGTRYTHTEQVRYRASMSCLVIHVVIIVSFGCADCETHSVC